MGGHPRPVCAACGNPADEGRCPTCRQWRSDPPHGPGPSGDALLVIAAVLLLAWTVLLAVAH
jgi:hypothetical protein